MNLTQFIVEKFNQDAPSADKIKTRLFALIDSFISAVLATKGLVVILNIKSEALSIIVLVAFAYGFYRAFELWHVTRILYAINPEDGKKKT